MPTVRSDDADIFYEVLGRGPAVVLLHPFPVNHEFWAPVIPALESRYRLILPDLRGHGGSGIGEGPAFMAKHASDVARVMDAAGVGKAAFIVCSIGGYIVFEFLRRFRPRVSALALCNTRPQPDTTEARANRLKAADAVLEQGTGPFLQVFLPKVLGSTTLSARPDVAERALRMMRTMPPQNMALILRGMAERQDSTGDLKHINLPTLIVIGEEDLFSTPDDGELMRRSIPGSRLNIIAKAGHYAPWERPEAVAPLLRQFLDFVPLV
jgi:pimeloyl-ACP methyl ester carboxylesterase